MPLQHVTPALAVLTGAVVALLASLVLSRRHQELNACVAAVALATAGVLAIQLHLAVPAQLTFSGTWALDGLTAGGTAWVCLLAAAVALLSPPWFRGDPRHGEWYVLLQLCTLGAIMLIGAADLLELVVGMLLLSVTGYTLASYHRASPSCAEAGAKYFFLGALANPVLLLGVVLLYGLVGTTTYQAVALDLATEVPSSTLIVAVALLAIGLAFELGAFPVHPWVPDVSQASPAPAAGFLTVVPKIAALFAFARVASLLPDGVIGWRPLVALMAVSTMTLGNLAALRQTDLRRLLGWSSVSQAGYGLMAIVSLGRSTQALPSLLLIAFAYGLANLAAFAVVVALRGRTDLADYRGLLFVRPFHAAALALCLLSLLGVPPLVGFFAKLALFAASMEAGYAWLALAAVLNTVVSVFYYLRVLAEMCFPRPTAKVHRLSPFTSALACCIGVLTVLGSLAIAPATRWAATLDLLP